MEIDGSRLVCDRCGTATGGMTMCGMCYATFTHVRPEFSPLAGWTLFGVVVEPEPDTWGGPAPVVTCSCGEFVVTRARPAALPSVLRHGDARDADLLRRDRQ